MRLRWAVTYRLTSESVKSCQIDYLVIGPTGIFIIEAKEWDDKSFMRKLPHIEADKAGLAVYVKLANHFEKYIPIYNIVVLEHQAPIVRYGRLHPLALWKLTNFMYGRERCVSKSEIRKIKRLIMRSA